MKFINLTPHPVVLSNGTLKMTFARDIHTPTARVELTTETKNIECEIAPGMTLSLPVTTVTKSKIMNLPAPKEGVMYIVSSMVATYANRPDVIAPNTDATCTRDSQGRVISVQEFQTYAIQEEEPAVPVKRFGVVK